MNEKDNSTSMLPHDHLATDDAPRRASTHATLLSLPREIRNIVYEALLPSASILIEEEPNRRLRGWPCLHARTYYDSTAEWIEDGAAVGRSKACSHRRWNPSATRKEVERPFGLLFACRKTCEEWSEELYRRNQFTFHTGTAMVRFVNKTPPKHVALIKDLRLHVPIGPAGILHRHQFVEVCRAFSGVRRLDAALVLNFSTSRIREAVESQWMMDHWARGLLNFAHLPLDHATVVIDHHRFSLPNYQERLSASYQEKLSACAEAMRLQLLAEWDRRAVVAALQARYIEEARYHEAFCPGPLFSLGTPHQRVP